MKFDIITVFPEAFSGYFNQSILKRAQEKDLIKIKVHNLRDFASGKHKTVDDAPFGGGPGMVLKLEPLFKAVRFINSKFQILSLRDISRPPTVDLPQGDRETNSKFKNRIILFSTRGKKFTEKEAKRLAKYKQLVLICGRYEGVDERVAKYIADEEISVGDFVLSGGELPAMLVVDAVSRFLPGVLGKKESLESIKGSYPTYTRPEIFSPDKKTKWRTPKILLLGDHKKIADWRQKFSLDKK